MNAESRLAGTAMPQPKSSELWCELELENDTLESTSVTLDFKGSHDLDATRTEKFEDRTGTTRSV